MQLYTKCSKCNKELIVDSKSNEVPNGITLNNKILCTICATSELGKITQDICKTYGLKIEDCTTFVKDETLYLRYNLGCIDREYYGVNDYYLVVNTSTSMPFISFDDRSFFELKDMDKNTIINIMELVKFMCG